MLAYDSSLVFKLQIIFKSLHTNRYKMVTFKLYTMHHTYITRRHCEVCQGRHRSKQELKYEGDNLYFGCGKSQLGLVYEHSQIIWQFYS